VLLATACVILVLGLGAALIFYLKSYHPTRVPVVERALVAQGMRAKVTNDARLRLQLRRQRQAAQGSLPIRAEVAPAGASASVLTAPRYPTASVLTAPHSPTASVHTAPPRPAASVLTAPCGPAPSGSHPPVFFQRPAAHSRNGAGPPGSYFRVTDAPSQETITSDVRGPWAAEIVTRDGRITLPDSGATVTMPWAGTD
jgi:hypothetical protein